MSQELELLSRAERMLAEVATARDAVDIADMAEVARVYAQRAKLGTQAINHATAIKVKAEMRLADIVDEGQAAGQIRGQGGDNRSNLPSGKVAPEPIPVPYKQLHDARKMRDQYTPEQVDDIVAQAAVEDRPVTRQDFIKGRAHVSHNSGENEWYTPANLIDAARTVLGGIDLDPASSDTAQKLVAAGTYYTAADDGLGREWLGRVWLNPPYSKDLIGRFVDKVTAHGDAWIVLVNNGTETQWGQKLLTHSTAVCFIAGRVKFLDPAGNEGAPLQGQMLAYKGDDVDKFADVFAEFGVVLRG